MPGELGQIFAARSELDYGLETRLAQQEVWEGSPVWRWYSLWCKHGGLWHEDHC